MLSSFRRWLVGNVECSKRFLFNRLMNGRLLMTIINHWSRAKGFKSNKTCWGNTWALPHIHRKNLSPDKSEKCKSHFLDLFQLYLHFSQGIWQSYLYIQTLISCRFNNLIIHNKGWNINQIMRSLILNLNLVMTD